MGWIKRLLGSPEPGGKPSKQSVPAPPPSPPPVYTRYDFSEPGLRVAAIGDLHGRIDLLYPMSLQLDALAQDSAKRLVEVYLGDYVDRGGNAREVVEFLASRMQKSDRDVICLRGNHEQLMLAALESDRSFLSWLKMGGRDHPAFVWCIAAPSERGLHGERDWRLALLCRSSILSS